MKRCPICKKKANSPHHIKPRCNGGKYETRNIIWLCGDCHNRLEGKEVTPELIRLERVKKQAEEDMQEERYSFLVHDDHIVFIGITRGDEVIEPFHIRLPKTFNFTEANIKKIMRRENDNS